MSERNFATQELKTDGGKVLAVYKVQGTSLYNIGFTSGGQVPKELLGSWTDPVMAQNAIKVYLSRPKPAPKAEVRQAPVVAKKKQVSKKKQVKKST